MPIDRSKCHRKDGCSFRVYGNGSIRTCFCKLMKGSYKRNKKYFDELIAKEPNKSIDLPQEVLDLLDKAAEKDIGDCDDGGLDI